MLRVWHNPIHSTAHPLHCPDLRYGPGLSPNPSLTLIAACKRPWEGGKPYWRRFACHRPEPCFLEPKMADPLALDRMQIGGEPSAETQPFERR
jgi:hypothetical protein